MTSRRVYGIVRAASLLTAVVLAAAWGPAAVRALRPADMPAQRNRHPKAIGSGAPSANESVMPRSGGRNYKEKGHSPTAPAATDNPGGSSPAGSAGKSEDAKK